MGTPRKHKNIQAYIIGEVDRLNLVNPSASTGYVENPREPERIQENPGESKRIPEIPEDRPVIKVKRKETEYTMRPRPKVYNGAIPVRLTPQDRAALEAIAQAEGSSIAAVIRGAVREAIRRRGRGERP